jgi:hypothetical protein
MWKYFRQTWRSVLAVVLAYVIVLFLFLGAPAILDLLVTKSHWVHDQVANLIGAFSQRGRILFFSTINDFMTFMTLMILFVRVVVISIALWFSERLVRALFGR